MNELTVRISEMIKSNDIQKLAKGSVFDFIKFTLSGDVFDGGTAIKNAKDLFVQIPAALFWAKMKEFLMGTFRDFEEQVRMSAKFNEDDPKFKEFVLQMIETVDKLDTERKVYFYSNLVRNYLLENIEDEAPFYTLRQLLMSCTISELQLINKCNLDKKFDYDLMTYSLSLCGLVSQVSKNERCCYEFTPLAKCLKMYVLTGDEQPKSKVNYLEIPPPEEKRPISLEEIDSIQSTL